MGKKWNVRKFPKYRPFQEKDISRFDSGLLIFINFADVLRKGSYSLASYPGLPVFSLFNRDKTMIVSSIASFGRYCMFLTQVFRLPDKGKVFFNRLIFEINKLGVDSIPLVIIISLFIGAVITIQMTINIVSPLIPSYSTGLATREILLLEFSSTMMSLILAGKVGSNIASEIGTMRVTEQIDALDIMGINSANFVVLPKIIGFVFFVPVLCILSMFIALWADGSSPSSRQCCRWKTTFSASSLFSTNGTYGTA